MTMNTNALHNILNFLGVLVASLLTFDWAGIGMSPETAVILATAFIWADKLIKIAMNVLRDGIGGLMKPQPPVQ